MIGGESYMSCKHGSWKVLQGRSDPSLTYPPPQASTGEAETGRPNIACRSYNCVASTTAPTVANPFPEQQGQQASMALQRSLSTLPTLVYRTIAEHLAAHITTKYKLDTYLIVQRCCNAAFAREIRSIMQKPLQLVQAAFQV